MTRNAFPSSARVHWLFLGISSFLILAAVAALRYFFGAPIGMVIAFPILLFAWYLGGGWGILLGVADFVLHLAFSFLVQNGRDANQAFLSHLIGLVVVSAIALMVDRMRQDRRRTQEAILVRTEQAEKQQNQIEFLSMLNEIVRAALEADDMLSMLKMLAQRVGELFHADDCFITRWDEKRGVPVPTAAYGQLQEVYASVTPRPGEETLTQAVLEAGQPLALEEVRRATCIGQQLAREFPSVSALGLPLISGTRWLGAVILGFRQPHAFTQEEIQQGEITARQISLAMTKVMLLEEARMRVRELAGLHMISQTFSMHSEDEIYGPLTDILADLFHAEICAIGLCDESGQFIQFQVPGHGLSNEVLQMLRYSSQMGKQAWDFERGGFRANSPAEIPPVFAEMAASLGIHSLLVSPLWDLEHRLMGAIYLANRPNGFDDHDLHLAEVLAEQAAGVIRNSRLLAAERRRARELAVLHAVAAATTEADDEDELLERAVELIGAGIFSDYFSILLLDESRRELYLHSFYCQSKRESLIRIPLDLGIVGSVARSGRLRNVPDVSQAPDYLNMNPPTRSELCVPLKVGDEVIGVLNAESRELIRFRREDEELLGILAGQLSTAIQRLRVARAEQHQKMQMERSAALFRALAQVGAKAAAVSDPQGVFRTLGSELAKLGLHCVVALADSDGKRVLIRYTSLSARLVRLTERLSGLKMNKYAIWLEVLRPFIGDGTESVFVRDPLSMAASVVPDFSRRTMLKILNALGIQENVIVCHLPLISEGRFTGVIWLWGEGFREGDLPALSLFARQVAAALQNARLLEEVRRLAVTDDLTGLYNRRYFFEQAEREFRRAQRSHQPLSALILDVDYFKQVNDQYGHLVGDAVLRAVGQRLKKALRETDLLGRYGGEEFSVLLPETDLESAREVAERLQACIAGEPIPTEAGPLSVQISIGVAALDGRTPNLQTLIKRADQAMYRAKDGGRNRISIQ